MVNRHLPFESWIFSPEELSTAERQVLREHLEDCESCQQLAQVLQGMESRLRAAPMLSPAPEFTTRWTARLAADQILRKRRQTFLVMLVSIGGAALLLFLTGWMVLPVLRMPVPVLLAWAYQVMGQLSYLGNLGKAVLTLSSALFSVIPLTLWVAILVAMGVLGATWLVAYQRLTSPRRIIL